METREEEEERKNSVKDKRKRLEGLTVLMLIRRLEYADGGREEIRRKKSKREKKINVEIYGYISGFFFRRHFSSVLLHSSVK